MSEERDKRLEEASDRLDGVSLPVRAADIRSLLADYRAAKDECNEAFREWRKLEDAFVALRAERDRLREALTEALRRLAELQPAGGRWIAEPLERALASGEENR